MLTIRNFLAQLAADQDGFDPDATIAVYSVAGVRLGAVSDVYLDELGVLCIDVSTNARDK